MQYVCYNFVLTFSRTFLTLFATRNKNLQVVVATKKLKFFDLGLFKATETQGRTGRRRRVRNGVSLPRTISMASDSNIFMLGIETERFDLRKKPQSPAWNSLFYFLC